jgi:uncharacterized protein (TIGR00251 family)
MPRPLRLHIHLQPRAACSRIVSRWEDGLKVQVQAPPVGGAANAALIELLAEALALPRRAIRIAHGASSRDKVVEIETSNLAACQQRVEEILAALVGARVDKAKGHD